MEYSYIDSIKNIVAVFSIMNPIAAGAVMLSITGENITRRETEIIARKNSIAVFSGMIVILFVGNLILQAFNISVHSIKVIGGVVLFLMALGMVQGKHKSVNHSDKDHLHSIERSDISVIPLGFPIILGPGLIATILTIRDQISGYVDLLINAAEFLLCVALSYLILRYIQYIQKLLSANGMRVFTRIMGLIVGAISVQMIIQGVKYIWLHVHP